MKILLKNRLFKRWLAQTPLAFGDVVYFTGQLHQKTSLPTWLRLLTQSFSRLSSACISACSVNKRAKRAFLSTLVWRKTTVSPSTDTSIVSPALDCKAFNATGGKVRMVEAPDCFNTTVVTLNSPQKDDLTITNLLIHIGFLSFVKGLLLTILCLQGQVYANDFNSLAQRCAPSIAPDTLKAIVETESHFNPYAIGVVGSHVKQPKSFSEAMATIAQLETDGKNYSVGMAQINQSNFKKYGINAEKALDACTNLNVAAQILNECFKRAKHGEKTEKEALKDALSCYYSGNFKTGYEHGYVSKVEQHALSAVTVPSIVSAKEEPPSSASSQPISSKLIF